MSKRVYEKERNPFGTPIASWVQDCDRNYIEDRIGRTEEAFGRLVEKLMNKGLLTQSDILDIVGMNEYNGIREEIEIREPRNE